MIRIIENDGFAVKKDSKNNSINLEYLDNGIKISIVPKSNLEILHIINSQSSRDSKILLEIGEKAKVDYIQILKKGNLNQNLEICQKSNSQLNFKRKAKNFNAHMETSLIIDNESILKFLEIAKCAKGNFSSFTKIKAIGALSDIKFLSLGIASGNANLEFKTNLFVGKEAIKTNSLVEQRILKLSKEAKTFVWPALEILNNDCSASHRASIIDLEKEKIFYLATRGLSKAKAKNLLMEAFINNYLKC